MIRYIVDARCYKLYTKKKQILHRLSDTQMIDIDIISAIILGALQGVTEWLPISSSGQGMTVMINLFGLDPEAAFSFSIYLHIGTLFAVILRFRHEVKEIISSFTGFRVNRFTGFRKNIFNPEYRLALFLVISTIATGIVGIPVYTLLKQNFEAWHGDLATALIGVLLILTGFILYISERGKKNPKSTGNKKIGNSTLLDMLIIGAAQGFTIFPGISRSGITIAALLFRKFEQEDALKISFLMSIPAVIGANILDIANINNFDPLVIFAGIAAAFVTGYLTIDVLMRFARSVRFDVFCVVFGILALLLVPGLL